MCLVCGNLSGEPHWTERRLDSMPSGGQDEESLRRHDRFRRLRVLNRVVAHRRLSVRDECGATRYLVTNNRGASEVLEHLGQLWPAVDRMSEVPVDPLDEDLLTVLSEGR